MSETSSFFHRYEQEISKINDAIIHSASKEIKSVYFDLPLLKDTRMGLLLSTSPELKDKFLQQLRDYNLRIARDFTSVYKKLPYTEDLYKKMWADPQRSESIFVLSPDTDISYRLNSLLAMFRSRNSLASYTEPVKIEVNVYPLQITKSIRLWGDFLQEFMFRDAFRLRIFSQDPKTIEKKFWMNQSWMFIDNLGELAKDGIPWAEAVFSGELGDATVVTPPSLTEEARQAWKKEGLDFNDKEAIEAKIQNTSLLMQHFVQCFILPIIIPAPAQVHQDPKQAVNIPQGS